MVVILGVGGIATYLHARQKVEAEMRAAVAVAGRIAHNAVDDTEEIINPRRRLDLLLADFHGDRHVRALLLDAEGHVVLASRLEAPPEAVPQWFFDLVGGEPTTFVVALPAPFDGLGAFILQSDAHNEVYEVFSDLRLSVAMLVGLCLLTSTVVYFTVGSALAPLAQLGKAFAQIGCREKIAPLSERGPIELATVYSGFNRMAERLEQSEAQNRRLHEQLVNVQEEERAEISRDLHDEIGPFLFAVDVDATAIQQSAAQHAFDDIASRAATIRASIQHMQRHLRLILGRLRSSALQDLGLADAVERLAAFWRSREPRLCIRIEILEEVDAEELNIVIYRIIQEAVSNAVRHGNPSNIEISVRSEEEAMLVVVADDGSGLPKGVEYHGFGVHGMKERVAALGGTITVRNRSGSSGVLVEARFPLLTTVTTTAGNVRELEAL